MCMYLDSCIAWISCSRNSIFVLMRGDDSRSNCSQQRQIQVYLFSYGICFFVTNCNMIKIMPFAVSFDLNVLQKDYWRIDGGEILGCKMNGTSVHAPRAGTRLTVYRAHQVDGLAGVQLRLDARGKPSTMFTARGDS